MECPVHSARVVSREQHDRSISLVTPSRKVMPLGTSARTGDYTEAPREQVEDD